MGKASRDKGKRAELQARDAVRKHWHCSDCVRAAQRAGAHQADLLDALPGVHVEVKHYARIGALRFLEQAERDRKKEEIPIVLMRQNGDPRWVVLFRIEDTGRFVRAFEEAQDRA